ncbi:MULTISPECIES: GDSL-type esterase/lipase family protein [unclassified Streptomyces]|uniref:GDSL-type esterase/lipase family protein n=1 Tax=unclassified Streptomyces TaxID=2593676 RepID=UPI00202E67DB|nr:MULTISPECIES: GDSL-type esterase/lipase family protein [unclassified Streptomyces]MCM1967105.1 GDSL-type esterase/lipase family protein [Streptomyces sp. G1]MCX5127636.1 GDSL-type esterase/lipase family protein [Streptomyces sp. NBC_00347]MCX5294940.1 GDSL-type esterase/lipase family protein [Streptomyces sp. NBC_00193]
MRSDSMDRARRVRRLAGIGMAVPLVAGALVAGGAGTAVAGPGNGPTAVVSLGDSYISGEAGRWKGNSLTNSGNRTGSDRAWVSGSSYDPGKVYGATAGGCHRSDSAEVKSAGPLADVAINLACSGAVSQNVFRASNGGVAFKGEAPQADQLAAVAASNNVKVIALSIGGNDLGFADIIKECAYDFVLWNSYCYDDQQEGVNAKIDGVMADVGKSVDEVRAVMRGAGYADSSYRIVLQSYPSPIPRGAENRYTQSDWSRLNTGGCPFWNRDSDWARDSLVPQIAGRLKAVAAAKGAQFLDLKDMMQGREVCAKASKQVTTAAPASAKTSEWARWIDSSETQGLVQESMHPNYFGQLAAGRCLALVVAQPAGSGFGCKNTAGADQSGMYLTPAP